nr:MAG TPA: hypothetical protein [Caudoviricetes sp.]
MNYRVGFTLVLFCTCMGVFHTILTTGFSSIGFHYISFWNYGINPLRNIVV